MQKKELAKMAKKICKLAGECCDRCTAIKSWPAAAAPKKPKKYYTKKRGPQVRPEKKLICIKKEYIYGVVSFSSLTYKEKTKILMLSNSCSRPDFLIFQPDSQVQRPFVSLTQIKIMLMNGGCDEGEKAARTGPKSRPRTTSPALLIWVMSRVWAERRLRRQQRQRLRQREVLAKTSWLPLLLLLLLINFAHSHFCIFFRLQIFSSCLILSLSLFRPVSFFILSLAHLMTSHQESEKSRRRERESERENARVLA